MAAMCVPWLLLAPAAWGLSPASRCEASKLKTAGNYGFCRLKTEAKAVKTGAPPDYSRCDEKYTLKWGMAESTAGAGVGSAHITVTRQVL